MRRFAAALCASIAAITFLLPATYHGANHHVRSSVLTIALLPAMIAWLAVLKRSVRQSTAELMAFSLSLALVGAGGLALLAVPGHMDGLIKETVENARFAIQAKVYVGVGILGAIGSFLFRRGGEGTWR
jgi:hypothetical protein